MQADAEGQGHGAGQTSLGDAGGQSAEGDADGQANARLIAAAPDLLEACALTINRVCQLCYLGVAFVSIGTHQVPDGGITPCQAVYLRAVVAKATRGQP